MDHFCWDRRAARAFVAVVCLLGRIQARTSRRPNPCSAHAHYSLSYILDFNVEYTTTKLWVVQGSNRSWKFFIFHERIFLELRTPAKPHLSPSTEHTNASIWRIENHDIRERDFQQDQGWKQLGNLPGFGGHNFFFAVIPMHTHVDLNVLYKWDAIFERWEVLTAHNRTTLWIHMSTHSTTRHWYYAIAIPRKCSKSNGHHRDTGSIIRGPSLVMQWYHQA